MAADLLILAHEGSYDRRFNVTSLAASATAVGRKVDLVLFFGALAAWVEDRWDVIDPAPPLAADWVEQLDLPPLSTLLEEPRSSGRLRVYACSASARLARLDLAAVQQRVDAVLGWQTVSQMIEQAGRVVTF